MIDIAFPQKPEEGSQALPERLMRRRGVHALFGLPDGIQDTDEVLGHLSHWLAAPGPSLKAAFASPLKAMANVFGSGDVDGRRCGDMRMDAVLEGMVRHLGMDPRAYALLTAFHPFETISLAGTEFAPTMCDNMTTDEHHVSAVVGLDGRNEISTEAGKLEIAAELPDTVIEAARGRPLTDIVDHPLLRGLGIVVHDLHLIGFGTRIVYRNIPSRTLWQMKGLTTD